MSTALPPEGQPELPLPRVLAIQKLANVVFWPFLAVFLAKFLTGLAVEGLSPAARTEAGVASLIPRDPLSLTLSILLMVAYLALAIGLTKACVALGRKRTLVVAWFLALPVIVAVVSAARMKASLGGLGGALGFVLLNALYASPAAIWLSVRRDVEERIEELSSLSA